DLNAPTPFDRTAAGETRSVAAANATRPIMPVNGGVRNVNVLMNLGTADYDGLQTQVSYRGARRRQAVVSYTLSKATNTTEPDGNGIAPNDSHITRLGEEERGPSVVDQRNRAGITAGYDRPLKVVSRSQNEPFSSDSRAAISSTTRTFSAVHRRPTATRDRPIRRSVRS